MSKLFNFREQVKCGYCEYCHYDEEDNSYYCSRKEMAVEAIEEFDECNVFEPIFSEKTLNAIKALEENLYYIPSDVHNILKNINSEDKSTIHKAIDAINTLINYYMNWAKNVKREYL